MRLRAGVVWSFDWCWRRHVREQCSAAGEHARSSAARRSLCWCKSRRPDNIGRFWPIAIIAMLVIVIVMVVSHKSYVFEQHGRLAALASTGQSMRMCVQSKAHRVNNNIHNVQSDGKKHSTTSSIIKSIQHSAKHNEHN